MSKDSSSSSEEDDLDSPASATPTQQQAKVKRPTKYQCPAEYVTFSHKPCSSLLTDNLKKGNQELWLLKAPASFNPECFNGIQVPLSGLQMLRVPTAEGGDDRASGRSQQIYSVLASSQRTPQLRLLTSHSKSLEDMVCGPVFSGLLNVCESYGDISANQAPQAIPAAPAPSIPPGLKQRFKPFGSKTPTLTCMVESEADCADANAPSSATLLPRVMKRFTEEPEDEENRKKKKKKKDKKIKAGEVKEEEEEEEVLEVKEEPVMQIIEFDPFQDADVSVEKRKKKKKKKDKERGEVGEEVGAPPPLEEVLVKSEPMDISYGDVEGSGKKKKKKKKSRTDEEV